MKAYLKIISTITLICFSVTNISFAQGIGAFKLSPPSSFTNMKGPEFREAAQIQAGILTALKDLQGLDVNSIKALGQRYFIEKSVFGKRIEGTIYFDEASECQLEGGQVRIERESYILKATTNSRKTYYALISRNQEQAGYEISVISDRVLADALKKGAVKFTHDSVNEKDKGIINLYLEHEITTENNVAIDEWIRERMERGEYTVDFITKKNNPLYKNAQNAIFPSIAIPLGHIAATMEAAGVEKERVKNIESALVSKPFILIPYDKNDLPHITISGERVEVTAHSSPFATYVFVPRAWYKEALRKYAGNRYAGWSHEAIDFIARRLMHEIGAMCGLKVSVKNGRAWNVLDEAVSALEAGKPIVPSRELQNLAPVNLLDLELRNDYAAGVSAKKSIFRRVMTAVLAGILAIIPACDKSEKSQELQQAKETTNTNSGTSVQKIIKSPATKSEIEKPVEKINDKPIGHIFSESEIVGLIEKLKENDLSAIKMVGEIGDKRAVEPLSLILQDKDDNVRKAAADALGNIGDAEAIPVLSKALVESEWCFIRDNMPERTEKEKEEKEEAIIIAQTEKRSKFRGAIAEALGKIGDKSAIPSLQKEVAKVNDWRVQYCAINALANIGGAESAEVLIKAHALEYITAYGNLIEWKPQDAKNALVKIGQPAVKPLIEALSNAKEYSSDEKDKMAAILGLIGDKSAVEALIQFLLRSDLNGGYDHAKMTAAEALGTFKDPRAIEPLIKTYLIDTDARVRSWAIDALGEIGDTRAIDTLIKALEDEDYVRQRAAAALDKFKNKPMNQDQLILYYIAKHDWDKLAKIGSSAVEPLIKTLSEDGVSFGDQKWVSQHAAETLGKIKDLRAVEPLMQALSNKEYIIRAAAAKALGEIGLEAKDALPRLEKLYDEDTNEGVHRSVREAIEKIEKAQERKEAPLNSSLTKASADANSLNAVAAAHSTSLANNKDVKKALDKKVAYWEQVGLISDLGKSDDISALDKMLRIYALQIDPVDSARETGARIVDYKKCRKNPEPLLARLNDESLSWQQRSVAAIFLGRIYDLRPAVNPLKDALKNIKNPSGLRITAAKVLSNMGTVARDALPVLSDVAANDNDESVRAIAKKAAENLQSCIEGNVLPAMPVMREITPPRGFRMEKLLYRIAGKSFDYPRPNDHWINSTLRYAFNKAANPEVDASFEKAFMHTFNDEVREEDAISLEDTIGDDDKVLALIHALEDELINILNEKERIDGWGATTDGPYIYHWAAAAILGHIGSDKAVGPLVKVLENKKENARTHFFAAEALGQIGDRRAIAPLIETLKSNEEYQLTWSGVLIVAHQAAESLGKLNDERGAEPLIAAFKTALPNGYRADGPSDISVYTEALGILGDKRAVGLLIDLLSNDNASKWARVAAANALGLIGDAKAVEPLQKMLMHKDEDIQNKAIEAIGKMGTSAKGALPVLKDIARNSKDYFGAKWKAEDAIKAIEKAIEAQTITPPAAEPKKGVMLNKVPQRTMAATQRIETAMPDLDKIRFGEQWRSNRIIDVLWDANLGVISKGHAEQELAALAPEVGASSEERNGVYGQWLAMAGSAMVALGVKPENKYSAPTDEDIRQIASRIKEAGVEVFIPKSQFPGDNITRYRGIVEAIGGTLRPYQRIEDLKTMIKNPGRSIVMTSGITDSDAGLLETLKASMPALRVINFAKMDDLDKMSADELDNYEAEILSILLVARIITPEDFQDKGSSTYRLLSYLLEDYMPEGTAVENYIQDIVTSAARLIKTILKALPITAYKTMRQSIEVLWAA